MKKVYKLLAAAIVALAPMAAMAQAATQPVALWGKLVSAPQKTGMGYDLAVASDGALYSLTSAGTMTDAEEIKFGTEVIGHGTTNSTTSGNQNLVLIKTDGNGNRLAALIYGPEQVIVVAGMNKIVPTVTDAVDRVRNTATPLNCIRLNRATPCASIGVCADCLSSDCICNQIVVTRRSGNPDRIKVILVGEALGY